jgi:hypothetical protein
LIKYRVIKPYVSPYPNSIRFQKGEKVIIGKEFDVDPDWKDWLWCTGESGQQAWTPRQFLEINGLSGILLQDYDAREISLKLGEIIAGKKILNGFAWAENAAGETGWAPLNHLRPVKYKA